MVETYFALEMEKLAAARWAKELRKAGPEAAERMTGKLYRLEGISPPSGVREQLRKDPQRVEQFVKALRTARQATLPEVAPRFSPEWRAAMRDIKGKNFVRLETGTSKRAANSVMQYGPSNPTNGPQENLPGLRRWSDAVDERNWQKSVTPKERDVTRAHTRKAGAGLYAADAGTRRTKEYAERAGDAVHPEDARSHTPDPATLSFDVPASMATAGSGKEYEFPGAAWKWTRNHRVTG